MVQYFSNGWLQEEPEYRYGPIARIVHDEHGEYKPQLKPEENTLIAISNTPKWVLEVGTELEYNWEYKHDTTPPNHIKQHLENH